MENDIVIAVDVAKSVFEVAVSDRPGHGAKRDRPSRNQLLSYFLAYPGATVVMEACGSAHYGPIEPSGNGGCGTRDETSDRPTHLRVCLTPGSAARAADANAIANLVSFSALLARLFWDGSSARASSYDQAAARPQ